MAKRRKKKRKIKLHRVFALLFALLVLGYLGYLLTLFPVRGYYIVGNTYYTDQEILKKSGLDKYPSYLLTTSYKINKKIKDDKLIKNIKIKKKVNGMFEVIVEENKILFYDSIKKKSIIDKDTKISYVSDDVAVLTNEISNKKIYDKFIDKYPKLDEDIRYNISEIKYDPNDIDDERFLFSMNDGNYVYATLSKIGNVNNYLEISSTLNSRKGILYLDYGNYFVPKE